MDEKYISELTAALYRVTERMDDREPLKWRLRERALGFEQIFAKHSDLLTLDKEDAQAKKLVFHVEEIIRMLKLCESLFVISKINFEMLIRGYERFRGVNRAEELPQSTREDKAPSSVGNKTTEYSGRRKQILEILADLESVSVKDLSERFGNTVSEKTLQRDLNDLIVGGSIETTGERRWRRYKILRM